MFVLNYDVLKVKRLAMIRDWYNQIPYSALKTKRDMTKYINWQQSTFSYLNSTKLCHSHNSEPKYKYGQQEQVTARNHTEVCINFIPVNCSLKCLLIRMKLKLLSALFANWVENGIPMFLLIIYSVWNNPSWISVPRVSFRSCFILLSCD